MILECRRALTGMPPFVVAMEEGHYGLWRVRVDDDDDDDDDVDDDVVWEVFLLLLPLSNAITALRMFA